MKHIINGKMYDDQTATFIAEVQQVWTMHRGIFSTGISKNTKIFKTVKGNWFATAQGDYESVHACVMTEQQVKDKLLETQQLEAYTEHFVELEEG